MRGVRRSCREILKYFGNAIQDCNCFTICLRCLGCTFVLLVPYQLVGNIKNETHLSDLYVQTMNTVTVYVLECEGGHYYVGKSNNVQKRIQQHFNSNGSEWTKRHKPIKVLRLIPDCDDADEDKFTKIMMRQYGVDKVRGGAYCQLELDGTTKAFIERELRGSSDKCYTCGERGHFAKDCAIRKTVTTTNADNEMDLLVQELKALRDKAFNLYVSNNARLNVINCQYNSDNDETSINTDASSISYIRSKGMKSLPVNGTTYDIVKTKRDMSILWPANYVIVKGACMIPKGYHILG